MKNDRLLGVFALVLGIVLYWATSDFPGAASNRPGPAFLPRILAVLFGICGIILIFGRSRQSEEHAAASFRGWMKVLGLIVGLLFYVGMAEYMGFIISASILSAGMFILLGNSLRTSLIATLVLVLGIYTLFSTIMGVVLPVGWLGW
ncbi:MAG: tripartite tricarboxylate transporter TctB family protein [bacterium]